MISGGGEERGEMQFQSQHRNSVGSNFQLSDDKIFFYKHQVTMVTIRNDVFNY